jgi:NADH-quinone oxidoreductase subunit G
MATLYIDNKPYEFEEGRNLLHTCLGLGFDIPHFCWHAALHSVGACRQCAIKLFKDENDCVGTIVMSCMTAARDNMRISIDDKEAREFRAEMIGFLMANHPHDCPVCDEGGECHLQDMTVLTGHTYREHRFKKRTHRNQDLGPFVHHEMNRCIACYRCVRFYRDYAGGKDLEVFGWHDSVYFGRHESGVLASEFAGNLVEVCPTGVFTDKTFRKHFTRKWDLCSAPSVCVHCSLGCNTIAGQRSGVLRRILNRFSEDVNGYFLCDRGRFGYEFVNGSRRVRTPLAKKGRNQNLEPLDRSVAIKRVAELFSSGRPVIGIGSGRASLESNFALRQLVGPQRFFVAESETQHSITTEIVHALRSTPAARASLRDVAKAGAVLVLGEDVTNTAPLLALAVRQACRTAALTNAQAMGIDPWNDAAIREAGHNVRSPLVVATPTLTKLDDIATTVYHAPPDDISRLGFAIAHALDGSAPAPRGLSPEIEAMARDIARDLAQAARPAVVSGAGSGSASVVQAAAGVAAALYKVNRDACLCMSLSECNSFGCTLLGGRDLAAALDAAERDNVEAVVVLEADLYRKCDPAIAGALLTLPRSVVVIDHTLTATAAMADLVLPAATFAEASGTFVNNEGRFQRFFSAIAPQGGIAPSYRCIADVLSVVRPESPRWETLDDIVNDMESRVSDCAGIRAAAPIASFREGGQKIARQSFRASGRTALLANTSVAESPNPVDPDSALAFSPEGIQTPREQPLVARYWAPGINSVQAVSKYHGDPPAVLVKGEAGAEAAENPGAGAPAAFASHASEWLVMPLHHIFGSEELSTLSPSVASLARSALIVLNPEDAAKLCIRENDAVEVSNYALSCACVAAIAPWVTKGSAALSVGRPETQGLDLPEWLWIRKAGAP